MSLKPNPKFFLFLSCGLASPGAGSEYRSLGYDNGRALAVFSNYRFLSVALLFFIDVAPKFFLEKQKIAIVIW